MLPTGPLARIHQWKQLLVARAIENQVYVAGINRNRHRSVRKCLPGCSMLVDYAGNVVLEAGSEETMLSFELDWSPCITTGRHFLFADAVQKFHQASGYICRCHWQNRFRISRTPKTGLCLKMCINFGKNQNTLQMKSSSFSPSLIVDGYSFLPDCWDNVIIVNNFMSMTLKHGGITSRLPLRMWRWKSDLPVNFMKLICTWLTGESKWIHIRIRYIWGLYHFFRLAQARIHYWFMVVVGDTIIKWTGLIFWKGVRLLISMKLSQP